MTTTTTQPHRVTINFAEQADKTLPYPYHVMADSQIGRQDRWKGHPFQLAGFQEDLDVNQVDVDVVEFLADPDLAIGLYPVFINEDGSMDTYLLPVDSVTTN